MAVATVDIQINSQGAVRSLNQVDLASRNTQSALQKLDGVVGSLAASFAAGFAINKVINDVKELDTNIRRLGTVGVDVAKINPALSALSDRLGGVANKAELAAASYQAASAGFSDTAGNIRILEAATKAATGGLADNQGVTEVLVKTLNAYGMSGTQAYQVTDSISKAVELGNQEWSDYVSQLGRVASMAALAGVSLDEMNAFIASATKNGATAEVAFTGLSAVLTQLLQPTKESQTAAAKLGIQWNLMGLQTKGLGGLMKELAVAIDKDKEAAARMVGPTEAMRGAFAAASKDGKDFETILGQIGDASGKTDADFQTMKGSLENTFKALDTSFKNLSEALGKAFGPTVVIAVQDITKAVNSFANFRAEVPQPAMDTAGAIVKLIAQILLVQKAIQGVIALKAGVAGMLAATAASATAAGTAAGGAATKVNMLKGAMLGLLRFGLVTLAIEIVVSGLGKLAEVQARMNAITKGSTKQFAEQVGGSATSRQEIENLKKQNREERARRVEEQKSVRFPLLTAQDDIAKQAITQLDTRLAQLQTMGERARFATPADRARADATPVANAMDTPATTGGGAGKDKAKKAKKERESELAQIQAANGLFASQEVIKARIAKAEYDQNQLEVMRLQMVGRGVDLVAQAAAIQREKIPQDEKDAKMLGVRNGLIASENQYQREIAQNIKQQQEPLNAIILANKTKLEDDKAYQRLIAEGINPEIAKQYVEIDRAGKALQKSLEPAVALAQAAVLEAEARGLSADQVERLKKKLEDLQKMPEQMVAEARGTVAPAAKPQSFKEGVTAERDKIKKELDELTKASNLVAFGAKAIGDSFATSFKGIVSGAMGAKEALASFFQGIASAFLDMASQIIAKWITMTILNSVLALFPGGGKGTGGAGGGDFGKTVGNLPMDDISRYAVPLPGFAEGGYVTGPTNAIIGEGGQSEYVIPASKMSQAMSNYSAGKRGASILGDSTSMGDSSMGSSTGSFTLETVVINNVEYATVDQVRAMSNAAAKQGAEGGFSKSMSSLRNSRSQRSRLGMR